MNKNRVLVAMSGGVDSSVALKLILDKGYDAIGITMKLWEYKNVGGNVQNDSNCCSIEAINNAKLVCRYLGVPHYTLNFQDIFRRTVVNNFIEEYLAGRTPNPCIRCNTYVKWDAFIRQADNINAYWIATGHYANIDRTDVNNPILMRGTDPKKDQSYVLWGIKKNSLMRTQFPLGPYTKLEVREIARETGLITAEIPESQEICFVPDDDYRRFLSFSAPDKINAELQGTFINENGDVLGHHKGIWQYTVGQRRRLGITNPEPKYVREINPVTHTITLASRNRMLFNACVVEQLNWLETIDEYSPVPVSVHIRYNHHGVTCKLSIIDNNTVHVAFESPQFAVTPGQSAVFYSGDKVLGGGIIKEGILNE